MLCGVFVRGAFTSYEVAPITRGANKLLVIKGPHGRGECTRTGPNAPAKSGKQNHPYLLNRVLQVIKTARREAPLIGWLGPLAR
jgi:hypothetical protein